MILISSQIVTFEGHPLQISDKYPVHLTFGIVFVFETRSHYVTQADLQLVMLLPQPSKCWNYRYVPTSSKRVVVLDCCF